MARYIQYIIKPTHREQEHKINGFQRAAGGEGALRDSHNSSFNTLMFIAAPSTIHLPMFSLAASLLLTLTV